MSYMDTLKTMYVKKFAQSLGCEYSSGEIGFGRSCIGIKKGRKWLGYNLNYEQDPDERLNPPDVVKHAYHKDNYIAILVCEIKFDIAIEELFQWVRKIDIYPCVINAHYPPHPTLGALVGDPFEAEIRIKELT